MRKVETHVFPGLNENVMIETLDDIDVTKGRAVGEKYYLAIRRNNLWNPFVNIQFQEGDHREVGVNGISVEALVAIVMDRLVKNPCKGSVKAVGLLSLAMNDLLLPLEVPATSEPTRAESKPKPRGKKR